MPLKEPDPLLAEGKPTQPHPSSSPSRLSDLWEAQIVLGGRWIFEDGSNIPKAQIHPDSDSQRSSAIAVALRRGNHSYLHRCFPFFLRLAKYHKWLGVVLSLRAPKKGHLCRKLRPFCHMKSQPASAYFDRTPCAWRRDSVSMCIGKWTIRDWRTRRREGRRKRCLAAVG